MLATVFAETTQVWTAVGPVLLVPQVMVVQLLPAFSPLGVQEATGTLVVLLELQVVAT